MAHRSRAEGREGACMCMMCMCMCMPMCRYTCMCMDTRTAVGRRAVRARASNVGCGGGTGREIPTAWYEGSAWVPAPRGYRGVNERCETDALRACSLRISWRVNGVCDWGVCARGGHASCEPPQ